MTPPPRTEAEGYKPRDYWTNVADQVRRRGKGATLAGDDTPFLRYIRDKFVRTFLPRLDVEGRRVLELGPGPGGNLRVLDGRRPGLLVGCDVSEAMVGVARDAAGEGSAQRYVVAEGRALPFRSGAFDLSFTVTVLQHNDDPVMAAMVGELCRVTRHEVSVFEDSGSRLHRDPTYLVRSPAAYVERFELAGFRTRAVEPLGVGVTYRLGSVIRRVFRPRRYEEGAPAPALALGIERATLPLARVLDGLVNQRAGLVRMTFRRQPPPA